VKAPVKVQQELMRHADIRTTRNVYGKAMDESKREAHGKVVRLVLPSKVGYCPLVPLEVFAIGLKRRRKAGGADGIRTHDLLDAIEARSQLRHGPTGETADSNASIRSHNSSRLTLTRVCLPSA
jgi:hypothetical protein